MLDIQLNFSHFARVARTAYKVNLFQPDNSNEHQYLLTKTFLNLL